MPQLEPCGQHLKGKYHRHNQFSSVARSCPTLRDPMNRSTPGLPCPSPTPGVHSNSHPSSLWCHPAISSSVVPFSSCPQPLPASESFPMSQLFASGGQSTYFKNYKVLEGIKWRSMLFKEKTMLVKLLTNLTFIILLNIFKLKCNLRTLNHS